MPWIQRDTTSEQNGQQQLKNRQVDGNLFLLNINNIYIFCIAQYQAFASQGFLNRPTADMIKQKNSLEINNIHSLYSFVKMLSCFF